MSPHQIKHLTVTLLLALAYFATGRLGLLLPAFGSSITLIWLPSGIAVAVLFRWGCGCWPGVALGAFTVNLAIGTPWQADLVIAGGNTLGTLLGVWILRRMRFHPAFDRSRDILLLAAAAVFGMIVNASVGIAGLTGMGLLPPGKQLAAWLTWWAGDALGVIAGAPLVLTFALAEARAILRHRLEFVTWIGATGLTTWVVFVANRGAPGEALALAFLPLPFIAWAALRFGPVGTSLGLILISVGSAYGTATQSGPFYLKNPVRAVELLWLFMATGAALGWLISAVNTARRQSVGVQRLFEQALSDVSLGVLLAGLDRRITYANQGFTRLTGYTEAELLGKSCALLQGPETDPATGKNLKAALRAEGFFDGEILNYRKDGTRFWNALLVSPVRDERGVMTGFLGVQRDVTKRKEAELALSQSEEHLRTIIELEPECVKIMSPEATLLEINPAGLAMIEARSIEEVRGCSLTDLVVPEDRATFAAMHRRAMQGATGRCEFAIVALKGTRRWLETHAVPYRNVQREIIGVLGITRDITERREAAAELERSFSTLQLFINTVPAYISFVDADERYRLVNKSYETYYGLPAERLIGQRLCDVQPAAAYAEMQPHLRAVLCGQTVRYQAQPTAPDGKSYWLDVQYVPRRDESGTVTGFFVLSHDITERKRAQLEREQLDRKVQEKQKLESLGVLAGGIAHDFNNLLTAILGNASLAQLELPPDSPTQDCLGQINEAALRAAELCKQMLAYSGRGRFVVQKLDLGKLVEQTAQMLQISISKKAVLQYRLEAGLPPVEGDMTQLRQVIMNLVINASEAIGDASGVISIATGRTSVDRDYLRGMLMGADLPEGAYLFLEVSDSGCGMSAETQARIFDPFFTTKFTGRGLGLAAVLGIVRGHKGALKVNSEIGRGTTFKLLFPAAGGASENPASPPATVPEWHGEGTVLVVDDEETMRSTLARMLRKLGLETVLACDGREAVEIFRAHPAQFTLVLLDLTMPHMDGEQAFTELRRLRSDVRVVLMSGFNAQEVLLRFSGRGLASFLQKPFTLDALRSTIREVLAGENPPLN